MGILDLCEKNRKPVINFYSHGRLAQWLAQVLYTHKAGSSNLSSPTIEFHAVPSGAAFLSTAIFLIKSSPFCKLVRWYQLGMWRIIKMQINIKTMLLKPTE